MSAHFIEELLPKRIGIGIDFGMTYSGAAMAFEMPGGALSIEPVPIQEVVGEPKFPTVVYVSPDLRIVRVGQDAWEPNDPANTYTLFKRHLGTDWSPRAGVDAVFLTRKTLEFIKTQIDAFLRGRGFDKPQVEKRYVFTFPGAWPPKRMLALKEAIRQAGFGDDPTLLDEATATAIAAARVGGNPRMLGNQQTTFVCDFGGGTTDFGLVQATEMGFIRLKFVAGGNPLLGMSNLDKIFAMLIADKTRQLQASGQAALRKRIVVGRDLESAWDEYAANPQWKLDMLRKAEALKRNAFSNCRQFQSDVIKLPDGQFQELSKDEIQPFVAAMHRELRDATEDYLKEAQQRDGLDRQMVRFIVIGGGGSALPDVGNILGQQMPQAELLKLSAEVATSLVQRGAAFYGFDSTLYDRRSLHSYGVIAHRPEEPPYPVAERDVEKDVPTVTGERKTYYPWYEVYVRRNEIIRVGDTRKHEFRPLRASQREVSFEVLEGEQANPRANKRIGEVKLGLPAHAKQTYSVQCTFTIGKDNLLLVRATGEHGEVIEQTMIWQVDLRND